MFESLEMRRLLSVSLLDGRLAITGTDGADHVALSARDGTLTVDLNGEVQSFEAKDVTSVAIRLRAGDDRLTLGNIAVGATVRGGTGNDSLLGSGHADRLDGGAGADSLAGLGGGDSVMGGTGTDTILGGLDADWMRGGRGADLVYGGRGADRLLGGRGIDDLRGGRGTDVLFSIDSSSGDISDGGAGSDMASYDGADRLARIESRQRAGGARDVTVDGALTRRLTEAAVRSYSSYFGRSPRNIHYWYDAVARVAGEGLSANADHSGTNVQVDGVDEADLVETDGEYLYFISGDDLVIAEAAPEKLQIVSRTPVGGTPSGIYLYGDRITIVAYAPVFPDRVATTDAEFYSCWPIDSRVQVTVLDVSDRTLPTVAQETYLDGSLLSSRQIDGRLYLVVSDSLRMPFPQLVDGPDGEEVYEDEAAYRSRIAEQFVDGLLPQYWVQTPDGQEMAGTLAGASDVYLQEGDGFHTSMTSVVLLDTTGPAGAPKASASLLGWGSTIYASTDHLYLTAPQYDWDEQTGGSESTDIWQFALGEDAITLEATGAVDGRIVNQFSMDEYQGTFRIATTDGWGTQATNSVFVLRQTEGQLATVGSITSLAPGESIQSVRFMGDRGYVVTFRRTDPLFTLDLSDAANPCVVGELVIPGFSSYLHPAGENLLLGFGRNADPETGRALGLQVSLFDVSDPANPVRLAAYEIPTEGYTSSSAEWDHLAFSYFAEQGIMAVPVTTWSEDGFGGRLEVIQIADGKLNSLGTIDHGAQVLRSLRIGDHLYSLAEDGIKVVGLADPSNQIASLAVKIGAAPTYRWWGGGVIVLDDIGFVAVPRNLAIA